MRDPYSGRTPEQSADAAEKWCVTAPAAWLQLATLYVDLERDGYITALEQKEWMRLPFPDQRERVLERLDETRHLRPTWSGDD